MFLNFKWQPVPSILRKEGSEQGMTKASSKVVTAKQNKRKSWVEEVKG